MTTNRRQFLAAAAGLAVVAANASASLDSAPRPSLTHDDLVALAEEHGSVYVVGLSPEERTSMFDGNTWVHAFEMGLMFYAGNENLYCRPVVFIDRFGEPVPEPTGFEEDWRGHEYGKDYFDPLYERNRWLREHGLKPEINAESLSLAG